MSKPKILLLGKVDHAHDVLNSLCELADTVTPKATTREEFLAESASGAFDGAVVAYRTFDSFKFTGIIDEEVVKVLPSSLRFMCHCGAGYDQISIPALLSHSPPILLSNVVSATENSTADTAAFLILGALRNFPTSLTALRRGQWRGAPPPALGHDPQGKVLGILGMGGIGRSLARKMAAFGMTTIYHNRNRLDEEQAGGAEYVGFEELLSRSDVLSLNLPLNKNTHHIISTVELAQTKPGVVIINTARGAILDESALVSALESGHVASVGLDVYEHEPAVHPGLVGNERVLLLPHMGTWSVETQTKMEEAALGNVREALERGGLTSVVPEMKGEYERICGGGK